ncbi:MAG TPA: peptidylprolyl isomerase [Gemmatimonadaceae bacterium]|nr:peptidylprolyl isomerase [Gemmatimonadaceae bacterium]
MKRHILLVAGAVVGLSACDGLKEAMTAHTDVAAKAGSQELSVTRLSTLLGESQVPLTPDVARTVTQMWVDYQLLAQAAAENDSLNDPGTVDSAMWAAIANLKVGKLLQDISPAWAADSTPLSEADYERGDLLAARHILFAFPRDGQVTEAQRDSVRQRAESVLAQVTPANFAQLASRYSDDGSKAQGGDLGVFPRGYTVPEFEKATLGLKPGQISPLVQSQFGYHIIMRSPYADVDQARLTQIARARRAQVAESTYMAKMEADAKVTIRPNAAKKVKEVAADLDAHRGDKAVLATSSAGDLTAARVAKWIAVAPPQQQLRQNIEQAPDSALPQLVRRFVQYELLIDKADSAGIKVDSTQMTELRQAFGAAVSGVWSGIGVNPAGLADSAKTPAERQQLAARRVESFMDALLAQRAQFVDVPSAVEEAVRTKYSYKVNNTGIDRAVEMATRVRAQADSAKAASQPPTAVPMPGSTPQGAPPGAAPQRPASGQP